MELSSGWTASATTRSGSASTTRRLGADRLARDLHRRRRRAHAPHPARLRRHQLCPNTIPFWWRSASCSLDPHTRGRTMLGCGRRARLPTPYMMGIEPVTPAAAHDEALDAIMLLLKCEEPLTLKTDWFELRQARLHLAPTRAALPIAVASVMTPSGVIAAGRHGSGVSRSAPAFRRARGAGQPVEDRRGTAAKHGKTMDRKNWKPRRQRPRGRGRRGSDAPGQRASATRRSRTSRDARRRRAAPTTR